MEKSFGMRTPKLPGKLSHWAHQVLSSGGSTGVLSEEDYQ